MKGRDVRSRLFVNVLASDELGHAERVFLIVAINLPTEYVDGSIRPGSRGMDHRGHFALHYDYLAKALHTSVGNVKKAAQRLEAKGWLSKVYPGTFGRPAGFHLLDVRGDKSYPITGFRFVPPYGVADLPTREDTTSPLTYRTPDHPNHPATSGVSLAADLAMAGSNRRQAHLEHGDDLTACEKHGWGECQDRECIEAQQRRNAG